MRFDIPVVGTRTVKLMGKMKAGALALQAGRSILLEQDRLVELADRFGVCIVAVEPEEERAGPGDAHGEVAHG